MINVKIIAHSISLFGVELFTYELCYPRFIHAEFMTHRMFGRNASSSRAIPVLKMIDQVRTEPAMPVHWGKNQPGMQANVELDHDDKLDVQALWKEAATCAADIAERMADKGAHKQVANRILEPFQLIKVIVTATEWDNFFELRMHPDAQPEIRDLAERMHAAKCASTPTLLREGEWHLPYVRSEERALYPLDVLIKISVARCARVSYLTHDGATPSIPKDLALYDMLVGARPLHASPAEHQATPDARRKFLPSIFGEYRKPKLHGNLVGFIQNRKLIEQEIWKKAA